MRILFLFVAILCIPMFWFGFNISGIRISVKELYFEAIDHHNSGEPWGPFDDFFRTKGDV